MARIKLTSAAPPGAIDVQSRPLITLYDGASLKTPLGGALVRYYPEAGLTSAEVERRVAQIRAAGAVAVRVQAKERDLEAVQTTGDQVTEPRGSVGASKDVRAVVAQEAARMKNIDQKLLAQVLDEALSGVGL